MLLVTAKVLFSFITVHEIDKDKTNRNIAWKWDSHVSIFGIKFISLFIACLIVFLFILLPQNFLLIFTKFSYKWKFVSKYLKPHLDAYQAPLKIDKYYYFGIELSVRPILFAVSNITLNTVQRLTIYAAIWVAVSFYLCTLKPFKSTATAILYMSYVVNMGCLMLLVLYYDRDMNSTSYVILYKSLILIALVEFGCTVLYSLYKTHLNKITTVTTTKAKVVSVLIAIKKRIRTKHQDAVPILMQPVESYEQLQEELLTADPTK